MTTYFHRDVMCSHCQKPSEQRGLGSTNSFGSADLDLRPPPMQRDTMDTWLEQCPHCGYVAGDLSTPDAQSARVDTLEYKAVLADPLFPELARRFLARALLDQDNLGQAGHWRLCAAWVCDDADAPEKSVVCRLKAAETLMKLKPFPDTEAGCTQGAVFVDVLRRGRAFAQAAWECEALLSYESARDVLRQVLEFQRQLIAANDAEPHTVAECTGGGP